MKVVVTLTLERMPEDITIEDLQEWVLYALDMGGRFSLNNPLIKNYNKFKDFIQTRNNIGFLITGNPT